MLKMTDDGGLLPLPVQVVKVICGLIPVLMKQYACPEGILGRLLLPMLLKCCSCAAQCIQSLLARRISHIGQTGLSSLVSERPELCSAFVVEGEAVASFEPALRTTATASDTVNFPLKAGRSGCWAVAPR